MTFEQQLHFLVLWTAIVIRHDDAQGVGVVWDAVTGPVWLDRAKALARKRGPRRLRARILRRAEWHQTEAMGRVANATQLLLPVGRGSRA